MIAIYVAKTAREDKFFLILTGKLPSAEDPKDAIGSEEDGPLCIKLGSIVKDTKDSKLKLI